MDTLEKQIQIGELEARLQMQKHAKTVASVEILKHKKKIGDYEHTLLSLDEEIEKTTASIEEAKKV
jgi:hypothetical protein